MGDCIDCGAPDTAVREWTLPSGLTGRVRRCEGCLARVAAWRTDVVRRRAERSRSLLAGSVPVDHPAPVAAPVAPGHDSRRALLAALEGLVA